MQPKWASASDSGSGGPLQGKVSNILPSTKEVASANLEVTDLFYCKTGLSLSLVSSCFLAAILWNYIFWCKVVSALSLHLLLFARFPYANGEDLLAGLIILLGVWSCWVAPVRLWGLGREWANSWTGASCSVEGGSFPPLVANVARKERVSSMLGTSLQTPHLEQYTCRERESTGVLCWFSIHIDNETKSRNCNCCSVICLVC